MTDKEIVKALEAFNGYTIIDLAIKLIKRQKEEIDHLRDITKKVRAKAINEFAERLKMLKCHYSETEYTFDFDGVTVEDIDTLVKEMTEGGK